MESSYVIDQIEELLESKHPKYRVIRVGNHLKDIRVTDNKVISFKTFLGIKYDVRHETVERTIPFSKHTMKRYYFGIHIYSRDIEFAIDEANRKVYWKIDVS